jgi:hypothetical protein
MFIIWSIHRFDKPVKGIETSLEYVTSHCQIKLPLVDTVQNQVKGAPVVYLNTSFHKSHARIFLRLLAKKFDFFLLLLFLKQFTLEAFLVHDCLKEHVVLIIKGLVLSLH